MRPDIGYGRGVPTRPSPQTDRVVQVFELLSADPGSGLSLAEVSRRLGVHKASCHSMLTALLRAGWLLRDPVRKTYFLGPALVRLGAAATSRFPILDLARPVMAGLSAATGAHCIAFEVGDDHVTVVDQVRNPLHPGHPMPVGTELPTRPPYGASLAAWLPADEHDAWLTEVPIPVREHYRQALRSARERGYAVGLHVLPDVRLQELASAIRAHETHHGRLSDLTVALTDEILHREDWFPTTLSPGVDYEVSHLDSPVLGDDGRPVLMVSVIPVESRLSGAATERLGGLLRDAVAQVSGALRANP